MSRILLTLAVVAIGFVAIGLGHGGNVSFDHVFEDTALFIRYNCTVRRIPIHFSTPCHNYWDLNVDLKKPAENDQCDELELMAICIYSYCLNDESFPKSTLQDIVTYCGAAHICGTILFVVLMAVLATFSK